MPLSDKTILDSHCFIHELKREMNDDLEYVKSLENEVDELESEKADFSNIYDLLLEECVSKDVTCSYLHSLSDLNANTELQCLYLHKVKECECLAQKLSKQTESVNKELAKKMLQIVLVFRKEREQYHEIQDLKAQMQDKNMVINELKKLILVTKGKSVETQFDKPSVVRQPNAQRIPKPSVLGKPTPFSNSLEMRSFQTKQSVNKTNVSDGLFKPVTQQNLPQNRNQANTTVALMLLRYTNPHMSKSSGVNSHFTSVSTDHSLSAYKLKIRLLYNLSIRWLNLDCTKHMTGISSCCVILCEKISGYCVVLEMISFAPILVMESDSRECLIHWVYYVEGLNHKLFLVGQFCVADWSSLLEFYCFVRDLQGNDLLNWRHGIHEQETPCLFKEEGIDHQLPYYSNTEPKRRCRKRYRTLVEVLSNMLFSASKLPLSFWAEAVATAMLISEQINIISLSWKDSLITS
ncbi:hypothetical protein Tco_0364925 [Tanacetum coccineum]